MNDDEKYLFDLNGYLVLRQVLTAEQVAACNEAIDRHADQLAPIDRVLEGDSQTLTSQVRQLWLCGLMGWSRPWCEPFRELLVHPRVRPYLEQLLGGGYRLNQGPDLVTMEKGCAGHYLHGGGLERPDWTQSYQWKQDRMHCGMTVVEFALTDENPGDGGVCVVPGGHKTNYPMPDGLHLYEPAFQEFVKEVHLRAGDVILFVESCTHGTLKWNGHHQRRTLIYRYTPGFMAFGRHAHARAAWLDDLTDEQRALLRAPGD